MVDLFFVSKVGPEALAALSFTFPIYLTVTAFSSGLGNGVVAVIARVVGSGDREATRELGTDALLLTVGVGLLLSVIGYFTIAPLFRFLGADPAVMPLVKQYMTIWYCGIVVVIFPQVSQTIARAHGEQRWPTVFMWIMSITNIVLDPILIPGWGPIPAMGLEGAAVAALVSRVVYCIGMFWLLHVRLRALAPLSFNVARVRASWGKLLHIGMPAIATQMVQPLSNAILTKVIAASGALAVAAYGVGTRIEMVTAIYLWGVAGALPPMVGQNVGARRMDRVRAAVSIAIKFCLAAGVILFVVAMAAGNQIIALFTKDPEVQTLAVYYFRVVAVGYALSGLVLIASQAMNALKRPMAAMAVSMARTFALTVPLALIGEWLGKIHGVFIGISAAGVLCGAAAWIMLSVIIAQEARRLDGETAPKLATA
jgi:putative MATE family efflux protein